MNVWANDTNTLEILLIADPEVTALLSEAEVKACFNIKNLLKNEDVIYKRIFG